MNDLKFYCKFNINHYVDNYIKYCNIPFEKIKKVYVLGNIAYDLDSFLCSNLLSIAGNLLEKKQKSKQRLYIPLINCNRDQFDHRFDIKYLCDNYKINYKNMYYFSDKLIQNDIQKNKNSKVILVDHNIPDITQYDILKNKIIGIYDHHKDTNFSNNNLIKKIIQYPLGSCTTLILKNFFLPNKFLFNFIDPLLSISPILIDTENFNRNLYRTKWVNDDKIVYNSIININKFKYDQAFIDKFFNKLYNIKYDEKLNLSLGIPGILSKDKKHFIWKSNSYDKKNIFGGYSVFQISLKKVIKKFKAINLFNKIDEICQKENFDVYFCHYKSKYYNKQTNTKIPCTKVIIYNYKMDNDYFINSIKKLGINCKKQTYYVKKVGINNSNKYYYKFIINESISRKHFEPFVRNCF